MGKNKSILKKLFLILLVTCSLIPIVLSNAKYKIVADLDNQITFPEYTKPTLTLDKRKYKLSSTGTVDVTLTIANTNSYDIYVEIEPGSPEIEFTKIEEFVVQANGNVAKTFTLSAHNIETGNIRCNVLGPYKVSHETIITFNKKFIVTYEDSLGDTVNLSTQAFENENFDVTFNNDVPDVKVVMNGSLLEKNTEYVYENNHLTIYNVSSNIIISKVSNAVVDGILDENTDNGIKSELDEIDPGEMSEDERRNTFSDIATTSGLYRLKGINGKEVLAYRGNVTNNYVSFAGQTWRILQVDENDNLRIVLNNTISSRTSYNTIANSIGTGKTINSFDNAKRVLDFKTSLAYNALNTWYSRNLSAYENEYIVNSDFAVNFNYVAKTSSGTYKPVYYYQSYVNVGVDSGEYNPELECPEQYIVKSKIGLLSAEEMVIAGGAFRKANSNYFLHNSSITSNYWLISPAYYDSDLKNVGQFVAYPDGSFTDWPNANTYTNSYDLRPVITINGNKEMKGTGTSQDPYMFV